MSQNIVEKIPGRLAGWKMAPCTLTRKYLRYTAQVHVFHAVIDGGVSSSPSNMSMHPEDIAETYYNLALQPRSAWTFELSMFAWADTKWYSI